jgi:hypothetical protein
MRRCNIDVPYATPRVLRARIRGAPLCIASAPQFGIMFAIAEFAKLSILHGRAEVTTQTSGAGAHARTFNERLANCGAFADIRLANGHRALLVLCHGAVTALKFA